MQGPVYKEDHQVTDFKIFSAPKGYPKEGLRETRTLINKLEKTLVGKDEIDSKKYLLFIVVVNATNNFKKDKPLASIQITSHYLIEYNITEQIQIDMACDLVERSIFNCYNQYIDKVQGTYLSDTTLTIPKSIKEDCIKQKLDRILKN